MEFVPLEIPDVILVRPDVHRDARGFFLETYHRGKYAAGGIDAVFVQDNHSRSARGTLRGLHAQRRNPQGKLVRVLDGEIWDVAVDIRRGSPHFGRFAVATLSATGFEQLWIPPGFAHGFCVLSERADVEYKCTALYDPDDELVVAWNDPEIGIPWPVDEPRLSERDRKAPTLAEVASALAAAGEGGPPRGGTR